MHARHRNRAWQRGRAESVHRLPRAWCRHARSGAAARARAHATTAAQPPHRPAVASAGRPWPAWADREGGWPPSCGLLPARAPRAPLVWQSSLRSHSGFGGSKQGAAQQRVCVWGGGGGGACSRSHSGNGDACVYGIVVTDLVDVRQCRLAWRTVGAHAGIRRTVDRRRAESCATDARGEPSESGTRYDPMTLMTVLRHRASAARTQAKHPCAERARMSSAAQRGPKRRHGTGRVQRSAVSGEEAAYARAHAARSSGAERT
jgi:hypothetical protein